MASPVDVYLEIGKRRVFAGAVEWPGWCRSARDADAALEEMLAYGPRFAKAVEKAAPAFKAPKDLSAFRIVQKLKGDATTDFGAPGIAPKADERPLGVQELKRLHGLIEACWSGLDHAAKAAAGTVLSVGPRGGGRELDAIVAHVFEADIAYLGRLGGRFRRGRAATGVREKTRLRRTFLETVASRAAGEPPAPSRSSKPAWTPRYAVRRSAWHALDHVWEIEDRM